ncbi:MAG TPA: DUF3459 domain-containing protein, partial [Vicinamibacterales bacterium]|nr:DUF3459 domain-containing protein [Vicinamibacterales bacterium]
EDETQQADLARPIDAGGGGLDAMWNDDFHHSALVAAGAPREGYYAAYHGSSQELVSVAKRGFLYQGQPSPVAGQPRGADAYGLRPSSFVCFLQNHDQIANSLTGARLHQQTSRGRCRALTALLLLGPWTPLIFQGDEEAAAAPFLFFADHEGDLARAVAEGRRSFLNQFASAAESTSALDPPHAAATFERCVLDHTNTPEGPATALLYRDLIAMRHAERPTLVDAEIDGAVLPGEAFLLRYYARGSAAKSDRLLVVNLGGPVELPLLANPLLAWPDRGRPWQAGWSSEDRKYGGAGEGLATGQPRWRLPAESAYWLA